MALGIARLQRRVPEVEAEALEQRVHPAFGTGRKHADLYRIAGVERQTDGNRLAVSQLVSSQGLQLVCGPMPVVQRAGAPRLERISAMSDLPHVQFRAAPDHAAHRCALAGTQRVRTGFEPLEEQPVADQRHLHRLGDPGNLVARLQRAQEV
ncbi:MAG: hypothetical protein V9G29_13785 [Burkholderiaceae bacterium]